MLWVVTHTCTCFSFLKLTWRKGLDLLRGGQVININKHLYRVHEYTTYSKHHHNSFFFFSYFSSTSPASLCFLFWDWNAVLNTLRFCHGLHLYLCCLFGVCGASFRNLTHSSVCYSYFYTLLLHNFICFHFPPPPCFFYVHMFSVCSFRMLVSCGHRKYI